MISNVSLTRDEKVDILGRWAYDQREIVVAEEKNMINFTNPHHHTDMLDEINKCLLELGVDSTHGSHPPTKQG